MLLASILTASSSCAIGIAGAGGGTAVGAAVETDTKTMAIGAGVGTAVGAIVWMALCFESGGVYSMGREPYSRPWYCAAAL
jgi:hypothetical protein